MFTLVREHLKEHTLGDRVLRYHVGRILESQRPVFRYTQSAHAVRGCVRVTLQRLGDDTHTPYVFDLKRLATGDLDIQPDNAEAKALWVDPHEKAQFKAALTLLAPPAS